MTTFMSDKRSPDTSSSIDSMGSSPTTDVTSLTRSLGAISIRSTSPYAPPPLSYSIDSGYLDPSSISSPSTCVPNFTAAPRRHSVFGPISPLKPKSPPPTATALNWSAPLATAVPTIRPIPPSVPAHESPPPTDYHIAYRASGVNPSSSRCIKLQGLKPNDMTAPSLEAMIKQFGDVRTIVDDLLISPGIAAVEFFDVRGAERACAKLSSEIVSFTTPLEFSHIAKKPPENFLSQPATLHISGLPEFIDLDSLHGILSGYGEVWTIAVSGLSSAPITLWEAYIEYFDTRQITHVGAVLSDVFARMYPTADRIQIRILGQETLTTNSKSSTQQSHPDSLRSQTSICRKSLFHNEYSCQGREQSATPVVSTHSSPMSPSGLLDAGLLRSISHQEQNPYRPNYSNSTLSGFGLQQYSSDPVICPYGDWAPSNVSSDPISPSISTEPHPRGIKSPIIGDKSLPSNLSQQALIPPHGISRRRSDGLHVNYIALRGNNVADYFPAMANRDNFESFSVNELGYEGTPEDGHGITSQINSWSTFGTDVTNPPSDHLNRRESTTSDICLYGVGGTQRYVGRCGSVDSSGHHRGHSMGGSVGGYSTCLRSSSALPKIDLIPRENEFDLMRTLQGCDPRTTIMIRNIPNKYSQQMLIDFINETHRGRYDFLYLRMDFKNRCNVGYAFCNMVNIQAVISFAQRVIGKKWTRFNSDKVCMMSYANIQGKQALIDKFRNSSVMDEHPSYRPKIFHTEGPNIGEEREFPPPTNRVVRETYLSHIGGHHHSQSYQYQQTDNTIGYSNSGSTIRSPHAFPVHKMYLQSPEHIGKSTSANVITSGPTRSTPPAISSHMRMATSLGHFSSPHLQHQYQYSQPIPHGLIDTSSALGYEYRGGIGIGMNNTHGRANSLSGMMCGNSPYSRPLLPPSSSINRGMTECWSHDSFWQGNNNNSQSPLLSPTGFIDIYESNNKETITTISQGPVSPFLNINNTLSSPPPAPPLTVPVPSTGPVCPPPPSFSP